MHNRKKYVIWGSSGHAKVIDDAIRRLGGVVVALFDNSSEAASVIPGVPMLGGWYGFKSWLTTISDVSSYSALVAIGGAHGQDRRDIQAKLQTFGLSVESLIHPRAFVADNAIIGAGSQLLAMSVAAASVRIGVACIINHKASVDHECDIHDGVHLAPGATLCGCVKVEENAMIGAGAVVLPHLKIGRNAIVGAGAVVVEDVPPYTIVVGNPARVIRKITKKEK